MPAVTVLMPAYNAEKYIKYSIDSILNQSFSDFEFIIINDCSTDNTVKVVQRYSDRRIRIVCNEVNLKIARTLNRGIELSNSPLIARIDADDLAHPLRLQKQIEFLNSNPSVALVGTNVIRIDESGLKVGSISLERNSHLIRWRHNFSNQVIHPTVMFRKEVLIKHDLSYGNVPSWAKQKNNLDFLEDLSEDYLLFGLLSRVADISNLPDYLTYYRLHNESISSANSLRQIEMARMVSRLLFQNLTHSTVSEKIMSMLYYTQGCTAPTEYYEEAARLLDEAVRNYIDLYKPPNNIVKIITKDAALRKRVIASGKFGFSRRVGNLITSPVMPLDKEELRMISRLLLDPNSVICIKDYLVRLRRFFQ